MRWMDNDPPGELEAADPQRVDDPERPERTTVEDLMFFLRKSVARAHAEWKKLN